MLMQKPLCWNCSTEDVTEMPRCFSISIQSEVAARARFPLTSPAWAMAPAVQQELLCQRGLAGVRMGDDGEGPPPGNFSA